MRKTIAIIQVYFGSAWPAWMPLFLASCRANTTIDWRIYTNIPTPFSLPGNVKMIQTSHTEFLERITGHTGISPNSGLIRHFTPYKLTDLKPVFAEIYYSDVSDYDYVGFGDIDVIYGNLRAFIDPFLENACLISTHEWCASGHLCLLANNERMRTAYKHAKNWRAALSSKDVMRFDEDVFYRLFTYPKSISNAIRPLFDLCQPTGAYFRKNSVFREQYTTPLTPMRWHDGNLIHPQKWFWKDGRIYNDRDGTRDFIYLHLMNFVKPRHRAKWYHGLTYWEDKHQYWHVIDHDIAKGALIDCDGIHSL